MINLAQKTQYLKPSATLKMSAKAQQLKAQGHKVINLTVGEPDWPTFLEAKKAGIKAIEDNFTKYTPASGIPALKNELAIFASQELNIEVSAQEVAVGAGAKYILFGAFQMLLNPGDEVLIPSPYWVSYPTMIELSGGVPVPVISKAENRFKALASDIKKLITPKTKILLLCSPSNPTGVSYTAQELSDIAQMLKAYPQIWVVSDDVYNRLTLDHQEVAPHILHVAPELKERTVAVNAASKSFSMTGWRIGWSMAPRPLTQALSDFLSQTTSNPNSLAQMALLGVLKNYKEELSQAKVLLKERAEKVKIAFAEGDIKLNYIEPDGAFYFFLDVNRYLGRKTSEGLLMSDTVILSEALLEQALVATVAGKEFGVEGYLRMSFVAQEQELIEGVRRIKTFLSQLK